MGKVTRRPHCARRRVSERNRRKAAALSAEMAAKSPAKRTTQRPDEGIGPYRSAKDEDVGKTPLHQETN